MENEAMMKRLTSVRSTMNLKSKEKDYHQHMMDVERMKKVAPPPLVPRRKQLGGDPTAECKTDGADAGADRIGLQSSTSSRGSRNSSRTLPSLSEKSLSAPHLGFNSTPEPLGPAAVLKAARAELRGKGDEAAAPFRLRRKHLAALPEQLELPWTVPRSCFGYILPTPAGNLGHSPAFSPLSEQQVVEDFRQEGKVGMGMEDIEAKPTRSQKVDGNEGKGSLAGNQQQHDQVLEEQEDEHNQEEQAMETARQLAKEATCQQDGEDEGPAAEDEQQDRPAEVWQNMEERSKPDDCCSEGFSETTVFSFDVESHNGASSSECHSEVVESLMTRLFRSQPS